MFKVFYADGTTYAGDPYLAPAWGVLVIVEDDKDHGRRMVAQGDYFCLDYRGDGLRWCPVDFIGMIDYLGQPGVKRVLIGRLVSQELWSDTYQRALVDPDFQPKTAWSPQYHERVA